MKKVQLVLMMILILDWGCSQKSEKERLLIGKWEQYKTENPNRNDTSDIGVKLQADKKWEFTQSGYLINRAFPGSDYKSKFELRGDTIYLNPDFIYCIETLNKEELVVTSLGAKHPTPTKSYFKKVNSFEEQVK